MYCQVIVDIVHENVARAYTYSVPPGMTLSPGQRVSVPFGPREKEGYVLSLSETASYDPGKIRPVTRPLEEYPAILPDLMILAKEMAEQAHCPLAETLRLMIPPEMRGGRVRVRTEEWVSLAAGVSREEAEAAVREGIEHPERFSLALPPKFDVEVEFAQHFVARRAGFYPGARQTGPRSVVFSSDAWYDCLRFFMFCL